MKRNYHTHTFRCYHAVGNEYAYIRRAMAAGIEVLGFSDHAPMLFPESHDAYYRMKPSLLPDYVETLLEYREKYRGRLEILIGFEVEYYPDYFASFLDLIRPYPIDYLILGQHFLGNEIGGAHVMKETKDERIPTEYVDQVIEGMKTGVFSYLAHPDVIFYTGDEVPYEKEMRRLCRAAKEMSLPLEYNLLGLSEGRNYPNPAFWQIAAEEGNDVVLGWDAHNPRDFLQCEVEERALANLHALGITPLGELPLRSVFEQVDKASKEKTKVNKQ